MVIVFAAGVVFGLCLGAGLTIGLMCAGTMMLEPPSKSWHRGVKI
jgi:hypothetical protein